MAVFRIIHVERDLRRSPQSGAALSVFMAVLISASKVLNQLLTLHSLEL